MKTKAQKNIKKIVSTSIKNQTKLNDVFSNLKPDDLSKADKEAINSQLDELEQLTLLIKGKILFFDFLEIKACTYVSDS